MRRVALAVVSTIAGLVLLLGLKPDGTGALPATVASPPAAVGGSAPAASGGAAAGTGSVTYTGDVIDTRWGPVQVEATLSDGTLTDVSVLQVPDENRRDQEINDRAVPVLVQESLQAGSADIDMVSGATVTSRGYVGSLQSALDQARG